MTKAIKQFERNIASWQDPHDAKVDGEIFADDREQLTSALNLVKEGDIALARSYCKSLDTIVRDQIPNSIWILMFPETA